MEWLISFAQKGKQEREQVIFILLCYIVRLIASFSIYNLIFSPFSKVRIYTSWIDYLNSEYFFFLLLSLIISFITFEVFQWIVQLISIKTLDRLKTVGFFQFTKVEKYRPTKVLYLFTAKPISVLYLTFGLVRKNHQTTNYESGPILTHLLSLENENHEAISIFIKVFLQKAFAFIMFLIFISLTYIGHLKITILLFVLAFYLLSQITGFLYGCIDFLGKHSIESFHFLHNLQKGICLKNNYSRFKTAHS